MVRPSYAETVIDPNTIKDPAVKSLIGRDFYVEKDHPYLSVNRTEAYFADHMASFQSYPDSESCQLTSRKCSAIPFHRRTKFRIESLVIPDNVKPAFPEDLRCPRNISACFFRVTIEDNTVAFIRYSNFQNASGRASAIYLKHPGLLQIEPATVSAGLSPEKKAVQMHFKKQGGIRIGYSSSDVALSWGQPEHKTKSVNAIRSIQVWSYHKKMITFVDDVVTDITTAE